MRTDVKKHLALRVLSTAAVMTMVTSIAAPAFADAYGIAMYGTYYVDKGSVTVTVKDGKHYITQVDEKGDYVTDEKGNLLDGNYIDEDESGVTITNDDKTKSTGNTITINADGDSTGDKSAKVTLDNVNMEVNTTEKKSGAIEIMGAGDTEIELNGNNTILTTNYWNEEHAAIEKADKYSSGTLTIKDDVNDDGSEKTGTDADTTGTLLAGGYHEAAAIGGGAGKDLCDTSNITITGGNITAIGGNDGGCGIGGGGRPGGTGKNIRIEGNAHVTAAAAEGAAIGGSSTGGNSITITDDAVVDAFGSWGSAIGDGGLDSGYSSNYSPTTITISGNATVNAEANEGGCAIGSGQHGSKADLTINIEENANVTAIGSFDGPAIGNRSCTGGTTTINITGGTVNAINSFGSDRYNNDTGSGDRSPAIGARISTTIDRSGIYEGGTCDVNINSSTGNTVVNAYIYGKGSGPAIGSTISIWNNITSKGETKYVPAEGADYNADGSSKLGESNSAIINYFRNASVTKESLRLPLTKDSYANSYHPYRHTIVGGELYKVVHNRTYMDENPDIDTSELEDSDLHSWVQDPEGEYKEPTLEEDGYIDLVCSIDHCGQKTRKVLPKLTPEEPDTPETPDTPDNSDNTTPSTPDNTPETPSTPDAPVQDETPDVVVTPIADDTTADAPVAPADAESPVQDATPDADAAVTPANAANAVQDAKADALPQTGVNWLTALCTALSGLALLAAGFITDRKGRKQN